MIHTTTRFFLNSQQREISPPPLLTTKPILSNPDELQGYKLFTILFTILITITNTILIILIFINATLSSKPISSLVAFVGL